LADARLTGVGKARRLILWVICGRAGAWCSRSRYFFPRVSGSGGGFQGIAHRKRSSARKDFVQGLGENLDGYQSTITFEVDDNAKTYLERETRTAGGQIA